MNYEETVELEKNIKIKNKAEKLYGMFLKNVKLEVGKYKKDGKFIFWSDSHNKTYFTLENDVFTFQSRFLHESYDVTMTLDSLFTKIKENYRGIDHLEQAVKPNPQT